MAIEAICDANRARLEEIRSMVREALEAPTETSALVQHIAERLGLRITRPTAYFLTRTTVLAALSSLEGANQATAVAKANRLLWERV
jgi:hypothetical protein